MRLRTALVTRGHTAGLKDGTVVPRTFEFMRVGVERGPSWAATAPSLLIKEGYVTAPAGSPGRTYDISPDGERFLLIKTASGSELGAAPNNLIVVQHFDEELKGLVPAN